MSVITYDPDKILIDFGGIDMPAQAVDANYKAVTIGGLNQPLLQYAVLGRQLEIDYPSDDYMDEPINVYVNGYLYETHIMPDPDTPQVWSATITAPTPGANITANGTPTVVVKDQFGDVMSSGFTVVWTKSGAGLATINASTGAYTVTAGGTGGPATLIATITDAVETADIVVASQAYAVKPASVGTTISVTSPEDDDVITEAGSVVAAVLDQYGVALTSQPAMTYASSGAALAFASASDPAYTVTVDGTDIEITVGSAGLTSVVVTVDVDVP